MKEEIEFTNQSVGQDALFNIDFLCSENYHISFNNRYYYYYVDRSESAVKIFHENRFEKQLNIARKFEDFIKKVQNNNKNFDYLINKEYFNVYYTTLKNTILKEGKLIEKRRNMKKIAQIPEVMAALKSSLFILNIPMKIITLLFLKRQYLLSIKLFKTYSHLKRILEKNNG